jgi:hypothetical protein
VPHDATLVGGEGWDVMPNKASLVHEEETFMRDETTLAANDVNLVRDEATLVIFGELLYKRSTSYQR